MANTLFNNQGEPFFKWEHDLNNNWLYLNWIGYISDENGRKATAQFLSLLENNRFAYVLNDNRFVLGPWGGGKEGNSWLKEIVFPKAVAYGLRYFAHVMAPNIASALLAQDLHQRISGSLTMQLFGDIERAQAWLREAQLAN